MMTGLLDMPWWGYVAYTLVVTHLTIIGVTVYLHRCQAHRALELHPIVSHFLRFWLWLTTGMDTSEWVAVHRKHHAKVETAEDPHSPQIYGIKKVLLEGAELYRVGAKDPETVARYSHGCPDDWMERNVYGRHSNKGYWLMMAANLILLGPIGLTVWAIQMLWIPIFAARFGVFHCITDQSIFFGRSWRVLLTAPSISMHSVHRVRWCVLKTALIGRVQPLPTRLKQLRFYLQEVSGIRLMCAT